LPVDDEGVIPSPFDPDYECVPVAAAGDQPPSPPPGGQDEPPGPRLCPEGYVPRRRRRVYDLDGKVIRTHRPAERNPDADLERPLPPPGVTKHY
jgi:hypothetical protein